MKFKNYILNEDRSKDIILEDAIEIVKEKCMISYNSYKKYPNSKIYRGVEKRYNYAFVDPLSSKPRTSPYASYNFYTLLMDNLPSWKKYPKRSRSIIAASSKDRTENYPNSYIIFPYDNAKIGVCSNDDLWKSFTFYYDMGDFVEEMIEVIIKGSKLGKWIFSETKLNTNWNYFKMILEDSMDELAKEENPNIKDEFFKNYIIKYHGKSNIIDYLNNVMAPGKNNFKLIKIGDPLLRNKEVWTDSPCVMVNYQNSVQFFKEMEENE